jgi:hypothetical protein
MTDAAETTRVVASMSGDEKAAALCDDVAANVQPDSDSISQHCGQIERSAEDMLARLDELVAVLNKLREDSKEQREALTPALEAWASGLARDFAYLDSAEETVEAVKGAVANVEHQLAQLESTEFRRARLADIEKARKGSRGCSRGGAAGRGPWRGDTGHPSEEGTRTRRVADVNVATGFVSIYIHHDAPNAAVGITKV